MLALALASLTACHSKSGSSTSSSTAGAANGGSGKQITIAVIPKGTTDIYWRYVKAGAEAAGRHYHVKIDWKGPEVDGNESQEINIMRQFIARRVSGIVMAPSDERALVGPVASAKKHHIPVIIIDSALDGTPGKSFVSFVATNNFKAGERDGDYLAKLMHHKGNIVMLRYMVGAASTVGREQGFMAAIKKFPKMHILVSNKYGRNSDSHCKSVSLDLMSYIRRSQGIFCSNETTTFGMLLALQQQGLAGKIPFVGFDNTKPLRKAVRDHQLSALMVQDPYKMAYTAVKFMVEHIHGKAVPVTLDTGAHIVTAANINTPAMKKLLHLPKKH